MTAEKDGRRVGRPPLTERRKAATRLEIAREAVRLFAAQGVAATTADEIAAAAGISPRTLWRYCSSKEECVGPLLTTALDAAAERLASWPRERTLTDGISTHPPGRSAAALAEDEQALRDLVRLVRTEPGLRAVWLQVHHAAEPVLARVLAARTGRSPDALEPRVQAALLNTALRVAVEEWAWHTAPGTGTPGEAITEVLAIAEAGLPR
ncbi:TetR/AcrR family transcriptional regulator [Streptomyces albidoflavus]|uniref:TetR family transcriptional regulator n=1 Tax=Streptomyces albidoflavus TaxID=1886 RepID=A0ABY3GUK9_9ACTN|nr:MULTISPECIES: TetR/AcrR family transcriptional regulator [Streptomyces]MYW58999.1 TetR family transcriptional regulator [Streptomyces sp. SID8370]MYW84389.1 TetR family transcriptional regulator [Streptomyces sp. SID8371]BDH53301.1 TetR family transcriptional regulator [Streptomyces albus]AGI90527.1 TetR-family transcriptional regulator [Streptomyces albidoflavus]ALM41535.1 TetR-family transcriptional regulator [Streptomyces sp. FR-008]